MRKITFAFLYFLGQMHILAQRVIPELDLQEPYDPDEHVSTSFDPTGFFFLIIIIFVIIIIWVISSQKKNRKYRTNKNIIAYHTKEAYLKSQRSMFSPSYIEDSWIDIADTSNGIWIEKGTLCTNVKQTSYGLCYAHFEKLGFLVCEFDDLTRI